MGDKNLTLPVRVSHFDELVDDGGLERGTTTLIAGGCGCGKTIFALQSVYNAALAGEKVIYFTLEEEAEKIRHHMKKNFGWDIAALEKKGNFYLQKLDAYELVKDIELALMEYRKKDSISLSEILPSHPEISLIDSRGIELPFSPDRIVIDSISALYSAFTDKDGYRVCMKLLIDALNEHNSANIITYEKAREIDSCSTLDVEEFLVDGVVSLYTIRRGQLRRRALEIVKIRSCGHVTEMTPYRITSDGISIMLGEKL
ncbi:MAG: ATPase domain-containing protein [Methanobacteriota archaeon]